MAGFTENEERLGRLVAQAQRRGVTDEALGLGGMRTVGPLCTMVAVNGKSHYAVNAANGIVLGRTYSDAVNTLRRLVAEVVAP